MTAKDIEKIALIIYPVESFAGYWDLHEDDRAVFIKELTKASSILFTKEEVVKAMYLARKRHNGEFDFEDDDIIETVKIK